MRVKACVQLCDRSSCIIDQDRLRARADRNLDGCPAIDRKLEKTIAKARFNRECGIEIRVQKAVVRGIESSPIWAKSGSRNTVVQSKFTDLDVSRCECKVCSVCKDDFAFFRHCSSFDGCSGSDC